MSSEYGAKYTANWMLHLGHNQHFFARMTFSHSTLIGPASGHHESYRHMCICIVYGLYVCMYCIISIKLWGLVFVPQFIFSGIIVFGVVVVVVGIIVFTLRYFGILCTIVVKVKLIGATA